LTQLVPKVTLLIGDVAMRDMPALYAASDVYVSATLGEGWGAPLMEVSESGMRLVRVTR
jgi:glycosyltransferase involved in cell wall biosynthesis